MGKWDWAAKRPPTLDEQRVAAGESVPHRSRKNTRRWCRGKVGVEHRPGVRMGRWGVYAQAQGYPACRWEEKSHWVYQLLADKRVATWEGTGEWFWRCYHEDHCTACGKVLGVNLNGVGPDRCPDLTPR